MRKTNLFKLIAILACMTLIFAGCSGSNNENAVDLNSYTLDEIIEKAKAEGHLESVGMPDSWANWGESWEGYTAEYGITHNDSDMSSAEELSMFESDPTRAIGDVGFAFTTKLKNDKGEDIVQSYKTSYWDSVPDWAKDADGKWMVAYTGCTAFLYNNDILSDPMPTSWKEVREGNYTIAIGDVVGGATGQGNVIATAYAFGGDIDNLQPAYDFWLEMAEAGRINGIDITSQNFESGEVPFGVIWSYNAYSYSKSLATNKGYNMTYCIPSDGAILSGYASVINANTTTPFAAALAREYIFSDQGQINLAKAGAIPTRTNVEIPAEVAAETFEPSSYAHAVGFADAEHYGEVCTEIAAWWSENILPLIAK
ncbi:MAG: extracellular solute-binding protein [Oscillospiraceae bacterium]|nr:extracellular solute-binding protein [Oscillospiraceae bacterium]